MTAPDGNTRSAEAHEELASVINAALVTPAGQALFDYMKAVSTNRVMPTTSTSDALWHLEGMRHFVYLLTYWRDEHERFVLGRNRNGRDTSAEPKRAAARKRNAKPVSGGDTSP